MKNLTNDSKNVTISAVPKFKGFEKLNTYELSKIKGGTGDNDPPVIFPD